MTNPILAIVLDGSVDREPGSPNTYYAGQQVSGHVFVQTPEPIKMRGIRLKLSGKAKLSWSEGSDKNRRSYSGLERYPVLDLDLCGSRSKDSEMVLDPGEYRYQFSVHLSPELPASYEAESIAAHIRYKAKATIDKPWAIDETVKVAITVLHPLDLNLEPPATVEPVVMQGQGQGCCCFRGFVDYDVLVNRGCFVGGETIFFNGHVTNGTRSNMLKISVKLNQKIEYYATDGYGTLYTSKKHATRSKTIESFTKEGGLLPGQEDDLNNLSLLVPSVGLPVRLDGCKVIVVKYLAEVVFHFRGACNNVCVERPIVIGNIALRQDHKMAAEKHGFGMPYAVAFPVASYTDIQMSGFGNELPKV